MPQLLIFRFCTGVGLGGAMPNFISLASEYAPRRHREAVIVLLWTGFPLGGVVVGLSASYLIDAAGWLILFCLGGGMALALAAVLLPALPESIDFLVRQGASEPQVRTLLYRAFPHASVGQARLVAGHNDRMRSVPVQLLFRDGQWARTLALWVCCFVTFLLLVTDTAWIPILLHHAGLGGARASLVLAAFSFGSVIGTPLAGLLIRHWPAGKALAIAQIGTAVMLCSMRYGDGVLLAVTVLQGLAGFCLGLASSGLIVSATTFYPASIRATGVGWAMGFGRLGSFVGPLALGLLVTLGWQSDDLFATLGAAAFCASLAATTIRTGTIETDARQAGVPRA
jgi:MFS transporter, AAHS family, 4-hydroxybenzoate transporter